MAITAKDVKELRERTGLGMMECKKALSETDGDFDAAIAYLREKLGAKMETRSDREAGEGVIAVAKKAGEVAMIQLSTETDFAARNEGFVEAAQKIANLALGGPEGDVTTTDDMKKIVDDLRITIKENISLSKGVKKTAPVVGSYVHHNKKLGVIVTGEGDLSDELLTGICQHIVAAVPPLLPEPLSIDEAGLPENLVEAAKAEMVEEAKSSGKPADIIEKMIQGKLRKWKDEHTLMGQLYIREMDAKKPIRDYIPRGAKITDFVRYALA